MGYSEKQLNGAYLELSSEQKNVLDEKIKRGMKTKWLNVWAKKKGEVLTEDQLENPEEAMDTLLEWILLDYEDHLTVKKDVRCECGRPLRHRYRVLHKETGQVYSLGRVHFEQHTGLSPELVREIMKGLKEIDLERDEILTKVIDNWILPFDIPRNVQIPRDMVEQLRVNIPLLDRQIARLRSLITKSIKSKLKLTSNKKSEPKQLELNMSHLNITPSVLYMKLLGRNITSAEAKALYKYVTEKPEELSKFNLSVQRIKKESSRALGNISEPSIRKWLVEIEYL